MSIRELTYSIGCAAGHTDLQKHGDEQYEYWPGIWKSLNRHLAESGDKSLPLASRAARAYLDICFYHPFLDGNGRLALILLDFLLTKKKVFLKSTVMVFKIPRYANDRKSTLDLIRQLSMLMVA